MIKRFVCVALSVFLIFSLAACGQTSFETPDQSSSQDSSSALASSKVEKPAFSPNTTVARYFETKSYFDAEANDTIEYMLHQPIRETDEKAPLFIFLHGLYEPVNVDSLGTALKPVESLMTLENVDERFGAYVLVPSTPLPNEGWWTESQIAALKTLIYKVIADYNIDEKRVSLAGISMGGYTTCRLVDEMPPNTFAAAVTISAASNLTNPKAHFNTAFRIYHAEKDETISPACSLEFEKQLSNAGHPDFECTVFEGGDHLSPLTNVFKNNSVGFFDWLFSQRLP